MLVCSANIACLCKWSNVTCGDGLSQRAPSDVMLHEMDTRKLLLIAPVRVSHLMRGLLSLQSWHHTYSHSGAETMGCLHLIDDDVFT